MKHLIPTLLLSAFVAQLSAQSFIVNPVNATDQRTNGSTQALPENLIEFDGFGGSKPGLLDQSIVETGDPDPGIGSMPAHTNRGIRGAWRIDEAAPNSQLTLTFDLASDATTYSLTEMHIWNYNEDDFGDDESDRGINLVDIEWSNDGGTSWFDAGNGNEISPTAGRYEFAQASALDTYTGERISFGTTLSGATDLRFTPVSNHGDGSWTGLSEVRFVAIPEPSTFVLVAISLVTVLGLRRRGK